MTGKRLAFVLIALALGGMAWWLLVPPTPVRAPRPEWTVVDGPQNAWHDYHRLSAEATRPDARMGPLIDPLIKGAAKPMSQRFYKLPTVSPTEILYTYRPEKTLGKMACEEARKLTRAGKLEKAMQLGLAVYKMGTDLAEPGSDLSASLAAIAIRREAAGALASLLEQPRLTLEEARAIQARVQELNARMPSPGQVVTWDREALARGLEDSLEKEAPPVPGLRSRMLSSVQARLLAQEKVLAPAMDSWDPARVTQAQAEAERLRTDSGYLKEAIPSWDTNLVAAQRQFYLDRVGGYGLECQAALAVYAREHGQLPEKLDQALSRPPKDPRTDQPPSYRIEKRTALIVYPGPDGQDDGGKQTVDPDQAKLDPGRDLVFRYSAR